MEKATIVGVDLAKNVFQLHGAADGTVLFRKKLTRLQFHRFMAEQPACLVAMEACGGAHYWTREILGMGAGFSGGQWRGGPLAGNSRTGRDDHVGR